MHIPGRPPDFSKASISVLMAVSDWLIGGFRISADMRGVEYMLRGQRVVQSPAVSDGSLGVFDVRFALMSDGVFVPVSEVLLASIPDVSARTRPPSPGALSDTLPELSGVTIESFMKVTSGEVSSNDSMSTVRRVISGHDCSSG